MRKISLSVLGLIVIAIVAVSMILGGNIANQDSENREDENIDMEPSEGTSIQCDEGNSGTVQIPMAGINVVELHEKHHWDMPAQKHRVIATLNWTDTSWELGFSIGLGDCPDNGEEKVSQNDDSGSITLVYEQEPLSEEQWFAHVESPDPENHRGESCDYEIEIMIFQCDCEP